MCLLTPDQTVFRIIHLFKHNLKIEVDHKRISYWSFTRTLFDYFIFFIKQFNYTAIMFLNPSLVLNDVKQVNQEKSPLCFHLKFFNKAGDFCYCEVMSFLPSSIINKLTPCSLSRHFVMYTNVILLLSSSGSNKVFSETVRSIFLNLLTIFFLMVI